MKSKSRHIHTVLRSLFFGYVILLCLPSAFVQYTGAYNVKDFSVTEFDGKIFMSWTTRAGFTCQDIYIQHSLDTNVGFNRVGAIYGVCGDTAEKKYSYIIEQPTYNQLNYVRIQLGTMGHSNVYSVLVIKPTSEALVLPHPATSQSTLFFDNGANKKLKIELYSMQGEIVSSITTIQNYLPLQDWAGTSQMLIYRIKSEDELIYFGKIIFR